MVQTQGVESGLLQKGNVAADALARRKRLALPVWFERPVSHAPKTDPLVTARKKSTVYFQSAGGYRSIGNEGPRFGNSAQHETLVMCTPG
jgi:hypothetical protein